MVCSTRSGLTLGRVGTSRMQRLELSDKPEKEAPAGNLSAPGKPVFLLQESCVKGRALDLGRALGLGSVVEAAGLWGRDVF